MFGYLAIPRGPALRGAEPCQLRYWVTSSAKLMRSLAVSLFAASLAAPRFLWDGDWGGEANHRRVGYLSSNKENSVFLSSQ